MQKDFSDKDAEKYAQAYMQYMSAKDAIEKEENYQKGYDLLQEMHATIGEDGLCQLSYLNNQLGGSHFSPLDYYETLSLACLKLNDYERALAYTIQWQKMAEEEYGIESAETANCLRRFGKLAMMDEWVEKELQEEFGRSDSFMSIFRYFKRQASPFRIMQRKLTVAEPYYQKGYDIMKKIKGLNAAETLQYKSEYVHFMCHEVVRAHVEETLWTLTLWGPLVAVVILIFFGFTFKTLAIYGGLILVFPLWRAISLLFFYYLTERHYKIVL